MLNAQQDLIEAEITALSNRRELAVAAYTVLSTMGRLNASELSSPTASTTPKSTTTKFRANGSASPSPTPMAGWKHWKKSTTGALPTSTPAR